MKEGQQIGTIGRTGLKNPDNKEHLHYEIKENGVNIDPADGKKHLKDPQKMLPPSGPLFDVQHLNEVVVIGKPATDTNSIQLSIIQFSQPPIKIENEYEH